MNTKLSALLVALTTAVAGLVWFVWSRFREDKAMVASTTDLDLSPKLDAKVLWFVNRADESELDRAGIHPHQRSLILDHRPITSLSALADVDGIGSATVRQAVQAVA